MANKHFEIGKTVLEFAHRNLLNLLEDVPEDKLSHQPVKHGNHALWIVGHIANTDTFFATSLGKREPKTPPEFAGLFGMGSKPTPDAGAYPPLAVLKDALHAARADLLDWFAAMSDEELFSPLPDDYKHFAPHYAGLMPSLAWHEGLHTGQLTVIRRSLGLAPKYG